MSALRSVRKYFSILSTFFVGIAAVHLSAAYVFSDSKTVPEKGGAVSVGFVGNAPSANPAHFRKDPAGDFVLRFLYRSLLRYDVESRTMQGDLANCDLGKNFSQIRCFLKEGAKWSDGTPITKADVLATYALFAETDLNKRLQASLAKTTFEESENALVFKTANPNVDLLDVFTVPVVSVKMAERLRAGTFSPDSDAVYSGPFVFEKVETEESKGTQKLSIVTNPNADAGHFVSKFVFRFFPDVESLVASKDSLNLIYPNRAMGAVPSPRFATLNLLLPEFVGLFANASRLSEEFRRQLLFLIGNSKIPVSGNDRPVANPFFTEESITPEPETKNQEELFAKIGFFKKTSLLAEAEKAVRESAKKNSAPAENRYFSFPSSKKTFVGGDVEEILISGNVPATATEVYINDYKLQGYVPKSGKFYYRAKTSIGTLKEGTNTYALSFAEGGKKAYKETLTIEYVANAEAREKRKAELALAEAASAKNEKESEAELASELAKVRSKFESLSPEGYYSKDLKKMSVKLAYVELSSEIAPMADSIAKTLENAGIGVEKTAIPAEEFQTVVKEGKKDYDLLLTGVNLGLLGYNVFPFFHSGQAEVGFNFSKVKNPDLDVLLEELKSKDLQEEGLRSVRERILAILKREAVVLTLTRPAVPYSIDRNVKNAKIVDTLPASSYLFDVLEPSYVKENRLADFKSKTVSGFLDWFRAALVGRTP